MKSTFLLASIESQLIDGFQAYCQDDKQAQRITNSIEDECYEFSETEYESNEFCQEFRYQLQKLGNFARSIEVLDSIESEIYLLCRFGLDTDAYHLSFYATFNCLTGQVSVTENYCLHLSGMDQGYEDYLDNLPDEDIAELYIELCGI